MFKINRIWENLREIPDIGLLLFTYPQISDITLEDFELNEGAWKSFLMDFGKKFTPQYIIKMTRVVINERLVFVKNKREALYKFSDKLHDEGVPYVKRMEVLNDKFEALRKIEEEARSYFSRIVRPISEWLQPSDIRSMKQDGMKRFFQLYFKLMFYEPTIDKK